jgi:hypothetical protein
MVLLFEFHKLPLDIIHVLSARILISGPADGMIDRNSQTQSFEVVREHHPSVVVYDFARLSKTADDFSQLGGPFQVQRWRVLLCLIPEKTNH